MTDEKLIEKLSELIRKAEKSIVVDNNLCARYPMNLLRKMVITEALYAGQERLEDAWFLLSAQRGTCDPVGSPGINGDAYANILSKVWMEYIKEDREKACPFKDGDIIISYSGVSSELGVFKHQGVSRHQAKVYFTVHEKYFTPPGKGERDMWLEDDARLANEEEKKRMEDILAKEGYRWNSEKKELEKIPRWRAEDGEKFYYVSATLHVLAATASSQSMTDSVFYDIGNYFRTPEAAAREAMRIREIFKQSKAG